MSAGDHLSDIQFSSSGKPGKGRGTVYAHQGNTLDENGGRNETNIVGSLSWGINSFLAGKPNHEIDAVWVHPELRRAGLATAMLGVARDTAGRVDHSNHRTEAGDAWAQSVGAARAKKRAKWYDRKGGNPG